MTETPDIGEAARLLAAARRDGRPLRELPAQARPATFADAAAIREVFRCMPKRGTVETLCDWRDVSRMLRMLGAAGFFALEVAPMADGRRAHLTALKGKAGACYETGRSANYLGGAAAALDDFQTP